MGFFPIASFSVHGTGFRVLYQHKKCLSTMRGIKKKIGVKHLDYFNQSQLDKKFSQMPLVQVKLHQNNENYQDYSFCDYVRMKKNLILSERYSASIYLTLCLPEKHGTDMRNIYSFFIEGGVSQGVWNCCYLSRIGQ